MKLTLIVAASGMVLQLMVGPLYKLEPTNCLPSPRPLYLNCSYEGFTNVMLKSMGNLINRAQQTKRVDHVLRSGCICWLPLAADDSDGLRIHIAHTNTNMPHCSYEYQPDISVLDVCEAIRPQKKKAAF